MLMIKMMQQVFLSAFAKAGERGLTLDELVKKLIKESRVSPALFGMRGLDNWVESHVREKKLEGNIDEICSGRFFIAADGLKALEEIQLCEKCDSSCLAYSDPV